MVITYILFVIGLLMLRFGAIWIVKSSSSLAKKWGVSSLIIGLTVVAFGTSMPELVVNLFAAFRGAAEVSFGNIIGSNIANILLVLGITAVIGTVTVKTETVWKQIPFALLAAFVLFLLTIKKPGVELFLYWADGLILLGIFMFFLYYISQSAKKDKHKNLGGRYVKIDSNNKIVFMLLSGLAIIYFGGLWVVDGAVAIATTFGLSEYLISATVIALGTSLPELAVSIVAVIKKDLDLAIGNIIGSNIFNILWVFGLVPLIAPLRVPEFISFEIGVMFLATLLLFIFMFVGKKHGLSKKEGAMFILFYILYVANLITRG